MSTRSAVHLYDRKAAQLVEAALVDGISRAEAEKAEAEWKPYLEEQVKRMAAEGVPKERWPQHRHWDWCQKQEAADAYLAYRMFGIECQSQMQGLMLVLTAGKYCRIESQKGKPMAYVHFRAAAPWNLATCPGSPLFPG